MANTRITNLYPTQKYKPLSYPIRPLLTLGVCVLLAGLGYINLMPMSWALKLSMLVGIDDLTIVPLLRVLRSITNLINGRKKTKAIVSIMAISVGIIGGIFLTPFLKDNPLFTGAINWLTESLNGSFLVVSLSMITCGLVAHAFRINSLVGIGIGNLIGSLLPITIPLPIESAYITIMGTAFISTVVSKQVMRLYYKLRYGHSNADGYQLDNAMNARQARLLGVQPEEVARLKNVCIAATKAIKKNCHLGNDLTGSRWQLTNSFKDIYYLLNSATNNADATHLKDLLRSTEFLTRVDNCDSTGISWSDPMTRDLYNPISENPFHVFSNADLRRRYHIQGMDAAFFKLQRTTIKQDFAEAIRPFIQR